MLAGLHCALHEGGVCRGRSGDDHRVERLGGAVEQLVKRAGAYLGAGGAGCAVRTLGVRVGDGRNRRVRSCCVAAR